MPTTQFQIIQREDKYWAERFRALEEAVETGRNITIHEIEQVYRECVKEIEARLKEFYQKYADAEGISLEEATKILTSAEKEAFSMNVSEYIKQGQLNALDYNRTLANELERAAISFETTRLQAMEAYLKIQASRFINEVQKDTYHNNYITFHETYLRSAYEIFKGTGVFDPTFVANDPQLIQEILARPWSSNGTTFSENIWINQQLLIDNLTTTLSSVVNDGIPYEEASRMLRKNMDATLSNCKRIIRTESAYFSSQAQHKCFEDLGAEKYRFLAELNTGTCSICGNLDRKVFKNSERQVGVNAVPMHPNCRCVEAPVIDLENEPSFIQRTRSARNSEGKSVYIPSDITYNEWKARVQDGTIDKIQMTPAQRLQQLDEALRKKNRR